ncbi:MAG: phosphatase PAP2 family protein [Sphingobacteriales bacterium]|nr:MAG: phosphatase PAP2 family protein [Sphingobacteriales bacterium]
MQSERIRILIILFFSLCAPCLGYCQETDTLVNQLDSLREVKQEIGTQPLNTDQSFYTETTDINLKSYFILLGSNLKQEVAGPFHSSRKTWTKVGIAALIEAGLLFLDKPVQREAVKITADRPALQKTSKYITDFGGLYEAYTLAAFGLYGWLFKNNKFQTTTLLASQSYITGALMQFSLKTLSGRERPNYIDPAIGHPSPTWKGPFADLGSTNSAFPSGHTTVAFAAATVYAMEYRKHIIFPIIAYSAASLIGISRLTENRHWVSDVFAGAALGYVTGRQVVNNYHRYARLQNEKKRKGTLSYNLDYSQGVFMGSMTYTFR